MAAGFTPINAPKRPLTPTSSVAVSSPFKRLAVDITPGVIEVHDNRPAYQTVPENRPMLDAEAVAIKQCPLPYLVQVPPSLAGAEIEMPKTPPGSLSSSLARVALALPDETDLWMEEFVNLDRIGDQGFVPVKAAPAVSHEDTFQTLSDAVGIKNKPFPNLDIEHLAQVTLKEEVTVEDEYFLEDLDEEEMAQLLAAVESGPIQASDPLILLQQMENESSSAESFSSKFELSSLDIDNCIASRAGFLEPDLLDEDVDWDLVTACIKEVIPSPKARPLVEATRACTSNTPSIPTPFVRPPFPARMRDRSVVVGLSSTTVMRTCFRIGELLNTHAKCTREKQDVTLELFARVNYSNRENSAKVQHFQLRDLFTDRQPFLNGVFRGWKGDGPVDHQTRVFLGPSGKNKMCRCICKVSDDKKVTIGRSATILSIRETSWDEVQWALRTVARDAVSEGSALIDGE